MLHRTRVLDFELSFLTIEVRKSNQPIDRHLYFNALKPHHPALQGVGDRVSPQIPFYL